MSFKELARYFDRFVLVGIANQVAFRNSLRTVFFSDCLENLIPQMAYHLNGTQYHLVVLHHFAV